jgi:hypothetical protein
MKGYPGFSIITQSLSAIILNDCLMIYPFRFKDKVKHSDVTIVTSNDLDINRLDEVINAVA